MKDEDQLLANPSKWFPEFEWSPQRAPDGLHRRTWRGWSSRNICPLANYCGLRRVWIWTTTPPAAPGSDLRSLQDIHLRHARDGFWHFPGETTSPRLKTSCSHHSELATDMARGEAGLKIVNEAASPLTFFTALERCNVGDLDNDRLRHRRAQFGTTGHDGRRATSDARHRRMSGNSSTRAN